MNDYQPRQAGCFISPCKLLELYAETHGIDCRITMIGRQFMLHKKSKCGLAFDWCLIGKDIESAKSEIDKIRTKTLGEK